MFGSTSDPLGTLLKHFRTRCHFSQQQLASAIGVHRMTISRWEEGSFLPESKALVLELAKQLHLDEQETRQFLEASLTALAPYWSVPLPRNPFFTGREEVLAALHTQLGVGQTVALTQSSALHGLGGIGKTQIALEYAYRYALEYRAVCWIGAETDEQIVTSLLHMADTLQLPERESNDQQRVVAAVQRWLSTHEQWLLIWDNVEDLHILQRFLPAARSGAMLLTTRRQALGTLARGLNLLPMEQEHGVLFLLRRAKILTPEASREQVQQFAHRMPARYAAAVELVAVLGGLPLALDQAGAYLEETRCGLPAYLDLFRTRRDALLQRRGEGIQDHPASVSTTFRLAISAAVGRHPAVRELLQVCALLQPDAIPEEFFRQGGDHLGPALMAVCRDPLEWDHVVSIACAYSLLARQPEERTLSLHRLMQAVLLDGMTETEQEQGNRQAIKVPNAAFPEIRAMTNYAAWRQGERLLPHALLSLHRGKEVLEPLPLASLAYKGALYLRERGQYAEAEPLYLRALHTLEQSQGPESPGVATALNNLALLYWNQGRYAEAEPLYLRALHTLEQSQGPEHLEVARPLHNLALLYNMQGRRDEAELLYLRALQIKEQQLGSEHLEVTLPLSSLAECYCQQGRYTEAEWLYVRVLHIREQQLEAEHPSVAGALHNLAECYCQQGRYPEAELLYLRALRILEQSQGPEHPDVAQTLSALAKRFQEQGKQTEAEALFQRVLAIREQQLGLRHPETAEALHNLALFRQKQGKQDEAMSFAEHALSIHVQSLGETHPKTLAMRTLLAHLHQEQRSARQATPLELHAAAGSHPGQEQQEPPPLQNALDPSSSEQDSVQAFLDACCELHPHVWCGISELWQAYGQWVVAVQRYVPLARRAFAAQLKTRGCRVDRTRTVRIWRGIRLKDQTL